MKKRIAVARALVLEPELVLFDEPTAGLDPLSSVTVTDLINHLGERTPVTCIVVTHEFGTAFRVATRLAMLHQGKIVAEGTPETFRRSETRSWRSSLRPVHRRVQGASQSRHSGRGRIPAASQADGLTPTNVWDTATPG